MRKKGQSGVVGFALVAIAFVFILTLFAIIEPFKETLDDARDTDSLNCPGTLNFNQTAYDLDNSLQRLTRRPTCFVTGLSMVYFVLAFIMALITWMVRKWRRLSK